MRKDIKNYIRNESCSFTFKLKYLEKDCKTFSNKILLAAEAKNYTCARLK